MIDRPAPWRLFLAIPLDDPSRSGLADALAGLDLPGRAVDPGSWHITLRFLGNLDERGRQALSAALSASAFGLRFELSLQGLAALPSPSRARVIFARGEEVGPAARPSLTAGRLGAVAALCEDAARAAGLPAERRPFAPHVTVARLRQPGDIRRWLDGAQSRPPFQIPLAVREIVLYRSHLGGGPPRYERVRTFGLE